MSILNKIFSSGAAELVKGVGGVLDNLTTSKEEKLEAKRKMEELITNHEARMEQNITDRWSADMNSDLLQLVLITVIGAYFGGRSLEKRSKK